MPLYLGIDLGTTGVKAVLVRPDGAIAGIGYREYPIQIPVPGYAEQNPDAWWFGLKEAVAEAVNESGLPGSAVKGIGFSGQMHGAVLLGEDAQPLHPAIIWCDQRTAGQATRIRETIGDAQLGKWVQNPISTGFQICSFLWMRENKPDIYAKTHTVLLPKDYIRMRMTGNIATEPTDACSTLCYDVSAQAWSTPLLRALDIPLRLLPDATHAAYECAGTLLPHVAAELGLKKGITVAYGGGDQPMQAVGNGILSPGSASLTLGTGGQILAPAETPVYDPLLRTHTFCHAQPGTWYVMGAILNCCLAQNWYLDNILHTRNFAAADREAENAQPGCGGLLFLPYLMGERTPHMNPHLKGAFFGLTLGHERGDMIRAVLEGVGFALMDAMNAIEATGLLPGRLIASGGGAASGLWRQIIADILGKPIHTSRMREQAGVGAAICAMVACGEFASLSDACAAIVRYEDAAIEPIPANVPVYKEAHDRYKALHSACERLC